MTSYTGSLKIAATADVIDAQFHVDSDRLEIQTGSDQLGSWSLDQLNLERRGDGLHLDLDGEDVVVSVPDTEAFVSEVAPSGRRKSKHKKRRATPKPSAAAKQPKAAKEGPGLLARLANIKEIFFRENWTRWLSDATVRWAIASGAVVVFALLALFATNTLGMILVLFGMIALIIAALAVSDDLSAYSWIPGQLSETSLVIAGAVSMVLGGLLIVLG